jgi:hypothetical protein
MKSKARVMFAVSVRGNYLFGYGLGQTPEKRELFAWANVAADVWKAFGLVAVSALWRDKRRRAAAVARLKAASTVNRVRCPAALIHFRTLSSTEVISTRPCNDQARARRVRGPRASICA